jgi:hypothetical protein
MLFIVKREKESPPQEKEKNLFIIYFTRSKHLASLALLPILA